MSKCDLSISLDKTTYKGGDTLQGVLQVDVDETCQCNGLVIASEWETTGKGDRDYKSTEKVNLFKGEWQPGQYHYPFEFVLPYDPISYEGRNININWHLQAFADIPWALDPSRKLGFILQAGNNPQQRKQTALIEHEKSKQPVIPLKHLQALLAGILFFIGLFLMLNEAEYEYVVIIWGASLIALYFSMQERIAEYKTGKVKHSLSERVLNPGDTLRCDVSFTPRGRANINSITATLIGKEFSTEGTGKHRLTYKHRFYEKQFTLMNSRQTEAGMHVSSKVNLDIPEDAVSSFSYTDNKIIWEVEISIDIDKWPDWINFETITVVN